MTIILALAHSVFRRLSRKKAFWILSGLFLLLTVALYVSSILNQEAALEGGAAEFVKANASLVAALSMITAVFVTMDSVSYEIGRSTIHLILARPIAPERCMAGMYAGSAAAALVPYLLLSLVACAGTAALAGSYLPEALAAMLLYLLPLFLLTAVVTLLSSWMHGGYAGLIGFSLFIFSFFSSGMDSWAARVNVVFRVPLRFLNLFSLRLDSFVDMVDKVVAGQGMPWRPLAWTAAYAVIVVALGTGLFRFRKV